MLRYLPLLFLFAACASDPLAVETVDLKTVMVGDGFTIVAEPKDQIMDSHDELTVKFSFRLNGPVEGALVLQDRYALNLPDLTIGENQPSIPVEVTEGVWQDLEVQFVPEKEGQPAILAAVYLNGNAVYYQQPLEGDKNESGPLVLRVDSPDLEVTDFRYVEVAGKESYIDEDGLVQLNLPNLYYEYYELPEGTKTFAGWDSQEPVETGYINRIDLRNIGQRAKDYAIRFTGKLKVPREEEYQFNTWATGNSTLAFDGKVLTSQAGAPHDRTRSENLLLTEGIHDFDLRIVQHVGWRANTINYRKAGSKQAFRSLNSMESRKAIATPAASNPRELKTDDEPFLLRSFLYFPAPKLYEEATKRTHVISVGEGEGPHYSIDLQTGALLQAWRGRFADVHEMWDGRGEPQVMRPLGTAIQFAGEMLVAPSAEAAWPGYPEEPDEDDFQHVAHELDESGRPIFFYEDDKRSISDRLVPNHNGLFREITHTVGGSESYYVQLAAASEITEVAPGEFALRSPGHRIKIESYDGSGLTLQKDGKLQRLIAELPAKGHVRYQIDW